MDYVINSENSFAFHNFLWKEDDKILNMKMNLFDIKINHPGRN